MKALCSIMFWIYARFCGLNLFGQESDGDGDNLWHANEFARDSDAWAKVDRKTRRYRDPYGAGLLDFSGPKLLHGAEACCCFTKSSLKQTGSVILLRCQSTIRYCWMDSQHFFTNSWLQIDHTDLMLTIEVIQVWVCWLLSHTQRLPPRWEQINPIRVHVQDTDDVKVVLHQSASLRSNRHKIYVCINSLPFLLHFIDTWIW